MLVTGYLRVKVGVARLAGYRCMAIFLVIRVRLRIGEPGSTMLTFDVTPLEMALKSSLGTIGS